jgi:virulence-associated protein VapD
MGGGRLATRDKRLEAIRRNPKNVRFAELRAVLENHGFCGRQGRVTTGYSFMSRAASG